MADNDVKGEKVEDYKIKDETAILLRQIRGLQRKIRQFETAKKLLETQIEQRGQELTSQSEELMSLVPQEPTRELQGMEFPVSEEAARAKLSW